MKKALTFITAVLGTAILNATAIASAFQEPDSPPRPFDIPEPGTMVVVGVAIVGGLVARKYFRRKQ
jgi:hypothetical protein